MQITLEIVGKQQLIERLSTRIPDQIHRALSQAVLTSITNLRDLIQNNYLSGPTGTHTLSVQTGALRRSVHMEMIRDDANSVIGRVFYTADVPYAAIHEFGGTIHLPDIVPVNAKALHFFWQGREVFLKKVQAHDVIMPERAPMRTAFAAMLPEIKARLRRAVLQAVQQ